MSLKPDKDLLINAPPEEVVRSLGTDLARGLSEEEAKRRLGEFGYNAVEEERRNPLKDLAKKFWNSTAWILEAAAVLSYVLGKYLDFYIIVALIVVNAFLSFTEEQRANRALELLKSKLQVQSRVLRDGTWKLVPAKFLVPGDVVRLRLGDFVPADVKLVEGEIEVDQSALTGESLPVTKKRGDVAFSGSVVRRGEATGVVILTGTNTYFGKTVELVKIARPRLRVEGVVSRVVAWMMVIVIALIVATGVYFLVRGLDFLDFLPLALVFIVAAIPIALPAMFTVSLALGSQELSRAGVLITRLDAIEGASTMNVLATDKTGTITMNKLAVNRVIPLKGDEREVLLYGALASREEDQDPIDLAIINKAKEKGIKLEDWKVLEFKPFDPSTRRTESTVAKDGKTLRLTKGSIDTISKLCGIADEREVYSKAEEEAKMGCRVLAVAKNEGSKWELVGLVSLRDPPRPDSAELIKELKDLGVKVIMLTGDAEPVARQIAKEVGIGENVVKVSVFKENPGIVNQIDGLAEVYPEDKFEVVKLLQSQGKVVGMTGDGVNDAPALRQADVGIAVSNATDVAKAAAAVVLTVPGLRNIVDVVKIGRRIYERVNIWILSRIIRTFQNVIFVALAFMLLGKYVISTFDMVLLLFMFDFVTITMSTDNVRWPRKPATWNVSGLVKAASVLGAVMVLESFAVLFYLYVGLPLSVLQTSVFLYLLFSNIAMLLNIRERRNFWDSSPSKVMLFTMIADIIVAVLIATFGIPGLHPVPLYLTLETLGLAFVINLVVNNFVKVAAVRALGLEW